MLAFHQKRRQVSVAMILIVVFIFSWMLFVDIPFGFAADQTPPYIATTAGERISVPTRSSKIYMESGASATVPGSVTIQKTTGLKAAITSFKDNKITEMSSYENDYINTSTLVDDNVALIDSTNTLIGNYRNDNTIVTANSMNDLTTKINNSTGNITIRIASLNTNQDLTVGSPTKSVTLIVDNLSFGSSNRTFIVYGNLILLNTIDLKGTTVKTIKTSLQTDGNLYIDQPTTSNSNTTFNVANMLYTANDFNFSYPSNVQADSFIAGGIRDTGYDSYINVTNTFFVNHDLSLENKTTIRSKDFIVKGDVNNSSYNCNIDIDNMFYANNNITIKDLLNIDASYLVVNGSLTNNIYGSTIDVTNMIYVYNDISIPQKLAITTTDLIVNGSVYSGKYDNSFMVNGMLYIENDFVITDRSNVTANTLFVGGNLTSNTWGQALNISNDIFVGAISFTNQTTVRSTNGDLIIAGIMNSTNEVYVDVAGRIAIGGNITHTGSTYSITAGGKTSSVVLLNETPSPSPTPTNTPPPTPVDDEQLLIKSAAVKPDDTVAGKYNLEISYKRLTGITEEHIFIQEKNAPNRLITDILVTPAKEDKLNDGYFTYNGSFTCDISIQQIMVYVTGRTVTSTYPGGGSGGGNGSDKPYFTTVDSERVSVPNKTTTIYFDHSANITNYNSNINKVSLKFLKKAISDYGRYFKNIKINQADEYENAATVYYNKTIDQIESIVASTPGNVIIKTDNLDLTKNTVLGSASKPVTLIVENLTVNTPRTIEVYGNLIVNNNFNANQALTVKTNKVNGVGGNFYTGNVNYNGVTTLNIAGMLYANNLTMNQGGTIIADTIVTRGQLTLNAYTQIRAAKDIYTDNFLCNQSANITATYGDLVIRNGLTVNSTTYITVGGRVCIGKRVIFNQMAYITAGGQKTALILPSETVPSDPVIVVKENKSKEIVIDLRCGSDYTTMFNRVASFSQQQVYFAGDAIFYKVDFPSDISNATITYTLNKDGSNSIFDPPASGSDYVLRVLTDGSTTGGLPVANDGNSLVVGPVNIGNATASYVIKTKLKRSIAQGYGMNVINNSITIGYTNTDGTSVSVTKEFTTNIVTTPALRMN